jgi:type II secretory pathway predicted ATPase ExeA
MKTTELRHFGLNTAPFFKEISDADLWLPPSKATLVDELCDAIEARESALLVGDPGAGKTCVLRAVRQRLSQGSCRLTYCSNVTLGRRDFYRQLCIALGLAAKATAAAVFEAVSTNIEVLAKERVHPVFLLDEAHLMHQDVLDHLHILMNFDWDSRALLSLVLIGLPDLADRLRLRRNRSLYTRLQHRFHIEPITPDDAAEYLARRLALAGAKREVFTSDAVAMIHEAATGGLRDIDRIATRALRVAASQKSKLVERHHLVSFVEEIAS